jgi:hypothetical protein
MEIFRSFIQECRKDLRKGIREIATTYGQAKDQKSNEKNLCLIVIIVFFGDANFLRWAVLNNKSSF